MDFTESNFFIFTGGTISLNSTKDVVLNTTRRILPFVRRHVALVVQPAHASAKAHLNPRECKSLAGGQSCETPNVN